MSTQSLNQTCSFLIIATLFTIMFSTQNSHANNQEMCIKHCVTNQCLKVVKNASPAICEDACKKLCGTQQVGEGKYFVPPSKDLFCKIFSDGWKPSECISR